MKRTVIHPVPPAVKKLGALFHQKGFTLFMVGGYVRNNLMGITGGDLDVCSIATPDDIDERIAGVGVKIVPKARELGTVELHVTVKNRNCVLEHTTFRKDYYNTGGTHRPKRVVYTDNIMEDARRRDFTVNAIYADALTGEVSDPLNGMHDLNARTIKAAGEMPAQTLKDDGLRLLRLVRFAAELHFYIQPELIKTARKYAFLLDDIAKERINTEMTKIIMADVKYTGLKNPFRMPAHRRGLMLLNDIRLLRFVFPELLEGKGLQQDQYHRYDVFWHNIHACAASAPDFSVRLAALLHDIGKPKAVSESGRMYNHEQYSANMAKKALKRLKYDNKTVDLVSKLIRYHMFDLDNRAKRTTVRKKAAMLGIEAFQKLILLREADFHGSGTTEINEKIESAEKWRNELDAMITENAPMNENDLNITGKDIMREFNITEGEMVGKIKRQLFQIALYKPSLNERKALLRHAKNIYKSINN